MPALKDATPRVTVKLYKTISRKSVDGKTAVSARYQAKSAFIDLTPFLGQGSIVTTTKSVRDPAGGFMVVFADRPHQSVIGEGIAAPAVSELESIYGLIEPMDMIEIRMWGGVGNTPGKLPIKMRGFVSEIQRSEGMSEAGVPVRSVTISGQDYGKIWQMYQILNLQAYASGQPLLTTFNMWERFGIQAQNSLKSSEFIRLMVEKIINPFIKNFIPPDTQMPKEIKTGDSISVKHGVINNSYQLQEGSVFQNMSFNGDVGVWNELYTEDREDGVHCVYRPVPAMHITKPKGAANSLIQDDATAPPMVALNDEDIQNFAVRRSDSNVANFYWVNNERYDLIDEMFRKLLSVTADDGTVNLKDHPNSSPDYYGVRPMMADTQQGDDAITNATSGVTKDQIEERSSRTEDWLDNRRRLMVEMNKDNVVFEQGSAKIKGGLMRPDGKEALKAGDYISVRRGNMQFQAYVISITDEFVPFEGYTSQVTFERSTGFVNRAAAGGAPWLTEQASR